MSNSSFYGSTGTTNNQTDAIEASVSNAAASETAAAASSATSTAQATISTDKATESAASAAEALVSKNAAAGSNTAATNSKNAAATSASAASSSASSASSSASTASTKASQASSSQSAASSSASTASTKASEASTSAASSLTAKNASVVAQAASEAARDASVVAKNASVVAQGASETAETNSETARDASIAAKDTSTTKANESAASAAAALVSKNSATASASTATTKANEASASATTSTASKDTAVAVTANFLGAHSSAPTQTASGGSLAVGMLYFDTGSDVLKVRASGGWINAGSSINGTSARFAYTLSANQTTVSGNDLSGNSLQFDAPFCDVFLNGVKLAAADMNISSGTSVVLAAGATAGDILEVVAFGTFQLTNGVFAGTTTVNNLTITGTTTAPTQAESDDSTKIATTAYVVDKITTLIGGAPSTLNDLNELAAAINDDSAYNSTLVTALATKMPKSGGAFTGAVTTNSTFDGVDIAARDAVLTATTTTANAALPKAGGTMTGALNIETGDNLQIKDRGSVLLYNTNDDNYARIRNTTASGNELQFSTNAVAMTIDISGNVGIGLTNPSDYYADQLVVSSPNNGGFTFVGATNAQNYIMWADGTSGADAYRGYIGYSHDNNAFRFGTFGTEAMRIDSSGRVLIGTTTEGDGEADTLTIAETGNAGMTIRSGSSNSGNIFFSDATSGAGEYAGVIQYGHSGNYMRFSTSGTERMRIDSSGNVTIGNPAYGANLGQLRIISDASSTDATLSLFGHNNIASGANFAKIQFAMQTGGTGGQTVAQIAGEAEGTSENAAHLVFSTASGGTLAERLRITSSGLHQFKGELETVNATMVMRFRDASAAFKAGIQAVNSNGQMVASSAAGDFAIRSQSNMLFATGGNTERMRIESSGNVGIGISNPVLPSGWGRVLHLHSATANGSAIRISDVASGSGDDGLKIGNYAQNSYLNNTDSGFMRFDTNGAEGMRLDSSRNFLVGRTTSTGLNDAGHVFGEDGYVYHTRTGNIMWLNTLSSSAVAITFGASGTTKGNIVINTSSVSYNTTSDYRLKENVDYDWDATSRLKQLKPARFNFIADADTTVDGFLAHEAQAIVPEAVTGTKDAMRDEEYEVTAAVEEVTDEDGNVTTEAADAVMGTRSVPDMQGIDQSKLVPLLVKTIQELEARITALEA